MLYRECPDYNKDLQCWGTCKHLKDRVVNGELICCLIPIDDTPIRELVELIDKYPYPVRGDINLSMPSVTCSERSLNMEIFYFTFSYLAAFILAIFTAIGILIMLVCRYISKYNLCIRIGVNRETFDIARDDAPPRHEHVDKKSDT